MVVPVQSNLNKLSGEKYMADNESNVVKLGLDGEPEPIGNEAQRAAGKAVASTFANLDKAIENKVETKDIPPESAQVQPKAEATKEKPHPQVIKEVKVAPQASEQEKANQAYKEAVKAGQTQSSGVAPVEKNEPNKLGATNVEVKANGNFIPPTP
jgi:hypothetical protein